MEDSADDILIEMGKAYRSFESYSDLGRMKTIWEAGTDRERVTELRFSTYFRRPHFFRFEWSKHWLGSKLTEEVNVIWCDGKNAYKKYSYDKKPIRTNGLGMAVAGATGVSSGTAHSIIALLIEDIGGYTFNDLENPSFRGSGLVDGEECYLVHGGELRSTDIWISKQRSIILRIDEDYTIKSQKQKGVIPFPTNQQLHITNKTIYSDVNINPSIADEVFSLRGLAANGSD